MVPTITIPQGFLYLTSYFHLCYKNILSVIYVDWDVPQFSPIYWYLFHEWINIMQGMQQKFEKSCFQCKKNTLGMSNFYISEPPKNLITTCIVNRLRYINNNVTKDGCSIPMDITIVLGIHKLSPQATIDYYGPFMYSGHYTTSIRN